MDFEKKCLGLIEGLKYFAVETEAKRPATDKAYILDDSET